jgi:nickel/cobalt transporter (NicO) family protein
MEALSWTLLLAAIGIGVTHTLLGPDHYLPFLMLGKARRWSAARTLAVTAVCGGAHVVSSLLLGAFGLAMGYGVAQLEGVEGSRGDVAAWALVGFGVAYAAWGIRQALRRRAGIEMHLHGEQVHVHTHGAGHHHHPTPRKPDTSFWVLFTIFILGPCEPLIPLFVVPASRGRWDLALATGLVFGIVTIGAMLAAVAVGLAGIKRVPFGRLERWSHAMAGSVIAASGLAILFLGL